MGQSSLGFLTDIHATSSTALESNPATTRNGASASDKVFSVGMGLRTDSKVEYHTPGVLSEEEDPCGSESFHEVNGIDDEGSHIHVLTPQGSDSDADFDNVPQHIDITLASSQEGPKVDDPDSRKADMSQADSSNGGGKTLDSKVTPLKNFRDTTGFPIEEPASPEQVGYIPTTSSMPHESADLYHGPEAGKAVVPMKVLSQHGQGPEPKLIDELSTFFE